MVLAALGILFVRKAVHAALLLAVVMIGSRGPLPRRWTRRSCSLVQIIVYTGAILMLFLFVLMLVGVDASDSVVETIRGQRFMAVARRPAARHDLRDRPGPGQPRSPRSVSTSANAGGNIPGLANLLFSRYVFAFEATSALLITAAVGAMVLAHRERLEPKPTQADLAAQRLQDYAESGKHPGTAADARRLRPAQRRRHPGPAARRHCRRGARSRGCWPPAARSASAPRHGRRHRRHREQLGQAHHGGRGQSAPATTEEEASTT